LFAPVAFHTPSGADKGALPDKDISSAVTGFGREMIAHTKKRVESEYSIAKGKKYDAVVIYGFVDCVLVRAEHLCCCVCCAC